MMLTLLLVGVVGLRVSRHHQETFGYAQTYDRSNHISASGQRLDAIQCLEGRSVIIVFPLEF